MEAMKETYNAYFRMQNLKWKFKLVQSNARRKNDKETADEYGDLATVVEICMDILSEECNLKFEP